MTGRCVYDCNPETRQFYDWAKRAKEYAVTHGFDTPVAKHEYQVLLLFYDKGIPSYRVINLLLTWRELSEKARVSLVETEKERAS